MNDDNAPKIDAATGNSSGQEKPLPDIAAVRRTTPPPLGETTGGFRPPPLPYAQFQAAVPTSHQPSIFHQAAKASWAASLVIVFLGVASNSMQSNGNWGGLLVVPIANMVIAAIGLICGIVGLSGIRRYGQRGLLAPALTGMILNSGIILLLATAFVASFARSRNVANAGAAPRPPLTQQQYDDSALKYPGWVGVAAIGSGVGVAAEISSDSPAGKDVRIDLRADYLLIALTINPNSPAAAYTIDTTDTEVGVGENPEQVRHSIPIAQAAMALPADPAAVDAITHLRIKAGQKTTATVIFFLPNDINPRDIAWLRVKLDGKPIVFAGKYLSVEEKAQNVERSKHAAS